MRGFPEYLRNSGWIVHVVSATGPALDDLSTVPGIVTHAVAMERQPSPPKTSLTALLVWVRLPRRVRPDLISVDTPKAGLLGGYEATPDVMVAMRMIDDPESQAVLCPSGLNCVTVFILPRYLPLPTTRTTSLAMRLENVPHHVEASPAAILRVPAAAISGKHGTQAL